MAFVIFVLLGFLGGLVRALYGLLKAVNAGCSVNKRYFIITLVVSALIGGLLGAVFDVDFRVAALAGYAGTDILENLFKGTFAKRVIVLKKK